jgi:V/A-type H+-transporting ATPase subunit C
MFQNNRVFEAAKCFSGEEKEELLSLIGTNLDVMNVTFVYRGKKYFNMPDEITLSILYSRYRVSFEMLKTIASLPPERMWEPLAKSRYASLLKAGVEDGEAFNVAGITRNMRRIQRESAQKVFLSGGAGIHFVLSYLILRELEILDISAIIEIVRYNYDRARAGKLLAYPLEERR